jgi:hypothetical protein
MTMAKGENIDEGVDYKKAIEIFATRRRGCQTKRKS